MIDFKSKSIGHFIDGLDGETFEVLDSAEDFLIGVLEELLL